MSETDIHLSKYGDRECWEEKTGVHEKTDVHPSSLYDRQLEEYSNWEWVTLYPRPPIYEVERTKNLLGWDSTEDVIKGL